MDAAGYEEDESLSQLLTELETLHHSSSSDPTPLSTPSLLSLHSLLSSPPSSDPATPLWSLLSSRSLPPSSLLRPLSASMDSSPPLLPSVVFLSLLLSPSSPVFSLFTPVSFLSLLRSLRRSLKPSPSSNPSSDPPPPNPKSKSRKRKPGGPQLQSNSGGSGGSGADLLHKALELLDLVLARVRLDGSRDGLKSLVETVAAVLNSPLHQSLPPLCFRILFQLVSRPEHGDQTISAVEVLRSLTPVVLLTPAKSPVRASALGFVKARLMPLGRENEKVRKALVYFPRFLVSKAPEKSEPRVAAVDYIVEVVMAMEEDDRIGFAEYAVKMTRGKAQLRLLAVDLLVGLLVAVPDPLGLKSLEEENSGFWGIKCLEALVCRCSDWVGGVRARALTNMAQLVGILSGDEKNHALLEDVLGFEKAGFIALLRKRCVDEKAAVRKAALLLIRRLTSLISRPIDEVVLKTMGLACSDPLVSIRKAAVMAISEVYRKFPDDRVVTEWLHAVLPLIGDNETSIQEECENLFLELVLDRISRVGKMSVANDEMELASVFPEGILALLKGMCDGEVAPCVKKLCASLGKKKKLKSSIASSLQTIVSTSESLWLRSSMPIEKWTAPPGAWQLLSEVSLFTPKAVDWKFLHHHWKLLDKANPGEKAEVLDEGDVDAISWAGDRVSLLQTISNVSVELPALPASELADNLLKRIENFNMHLSEVDAHVKALRTICKRKAISSVEGNTLVLQWVHQLLTKALKILDYYVTEVSDARKGNSFLTPPSGRRKGKKEASALNSMLQAVTAVFTIGSLILICPSADIQGITPLLHSIITSGNTETKSKRLAGFTISLKEMAPPLYIQSWVTMGKICLVDGKLAKRYIPLFVQELEKSDCAALRNNIMVVMADFCVRYTALVDCYISKITVSLSDPCEVVRRQTFILLSRLLQRDYVKWRGVLFLRFLLSLVDESEKIRTLADFLFGNILKVKAPLLAYNSFIEAIFVLNDCNAHSGQSETQGGQVGRPLFSLRGNDEKSRSQRMHIYISLLRQMAPEHLLATTAKICAEILAAASDGLLSVDDATGQSVLQDALQILACKEMRIHPNRSSDSADMDEEGGDTGSGSSTAAGALQAARGRVVTQVAKKNLIQNAVPVFIELKRLLESKNSRLTGCLMECLRVLLKDFKNEIDEILVADKQLKKELIYDMQKYEATKARSAVAEAVASVQRSGARGGRDQGYRSPADRATATGICATVSERLGTEGKVIGSAVADVAARATIRSVLKEVNQSGPAVGSPPFHSMSVPKLKSNTGHGGTTRGGRSVNVLESVRRRQAFESDDEN